jgi:hypothetical protein
MPGTHTNRCLISRLLIGAAMLAGLELLALLTGSASPGAAPAWGQSPIRFRVIRKSTPVVIKSREAAEIDMEEPGVEILTRGPVHEAFAAPLALDPEPGLVVLDPPPPPLDEQPPDEAPDLGAGALAWIPGYWAWDDDRDSYIWVSGVWRIPPPDCTWVPGYWARTSDGYQWSPGFWDADEDDEVAYLPRPPQSRDEEPSGTAPGPDYVWVPGTWYWQDGYDVQPLRNVNIRIEVHRSGFFWRPGYWLRARPDWVWIPAHYVWAPRGYVFVDGHWDYDLPRRGLPFAPLYIEANLRLSRDFRYVPRVVINTDLLVTHLFTRVRYEHYYFGDYYAARFERRGICPWFETQRIAYDPLYVHQVWRHRDDEHWAVNLRSQYEARRDNRMPRPPDTWRRQIEEARHLSAELRPAYTITQPLTDLRRNQTVFTLRRVDDQRRQALAQRAGEVRDLRQAREKWEPPAQPRVTPGDARPPREPYRVTLDRAPITGKRPEARGAAQSAPPRSDAPQPQKVKRTERPPAGTERRP